MTLTGCEQQELEKEYKVFYEQGSNQLKIQWESKWLCVHV